MLSCITPHMGEEMWELYGHSSSIALESWPTYDEAKMAGTFVRYPERSELNGEINESLIVEFYNR